MLILEQLQGSRKTNNFLLLRQEYYIPPPQPKYECYTSILDPKCYYGQVLNMCFIKKIKRIYPYVPNNTYERI